MDGHFGVIWFPNHRVEFDDFSVDQDLLVRIGLLLCVKEFHTVLGGFLLEVFIGYSEVVSLRVEEKIQRL